MAIIIHGGDTFVVVYGGQLEVDAIKLSIKQFWSKGLRKAKAKFVDPGNPDTATRYYKFKLKGYPFFVPSSRTEFIQCRKLCTHILYSMYDLGWKIINCPADLHSVIRRMLKVLGKRFTEK